MEKMHKNPPSIFNDVIGPVMRGPSSSHCAAALRIGRIARDVMDGQVDEVEIKFDSGGSLATTHKTQGSDMGLFGGLMGMEVTDERLKDSENLLNESGIRVQIAIEPLSDPHPNTYNIRLKNKQVEHTLIAISTGGGIIEINSIDGYKLSIAGDYFETIIICSNSGSELDKYIKKNILPEEIYIHTSDKDALIQVKTVTEISEQTIENIRNQAGSEIQDIIKISPVLPVLSHANMKLPFLTVDEMCQYQKSGNLRLWELAVLYESARGNLSQSDVIEKMENIVDILQKSINSGLAGTKYKDRILGFQSGKFAEKSESGELLDAGMLNRMTMYVTALMEVKSSMGIIVAAPTAGACGGLPGAIIGAAHFEQRSKEEMVQAMLAAGLIGVFIAHGATFAAEVAGLVELAGGSVDQAIIAASLALQNTFGMTCDPVANRVEAPCLGKNVMAAANAITCANMALSDFDSLIPLDEVIEAMYKVGTSLPHELRCTALGGLSTTKTAKKIEQELLNIKDEPQRIRRRH
jgi:L-serine dehydratase